MTVHLALLHGVLPAVFGPVDTLDIADDLFEA